MKSVLRECQEGMSQGEHKVSRSAHFPDVLEYKGMIRKMTLSGAYLRLDPILTPKESS